MEIARIKDLQKPDLFEKFKTQLHKDYEMCGLTELTPILSSNDLEHVYHQILNSILLLEKKESSVLQNLLYRIDVTEVQIKREASQNPEKNFQQILSELIIKRILQKVILKQEYSK